MDGFCLERKGADKGVWVGKMKFLIDEECGSDKDGVVKAYERVRSGRAKGKVVIDMTRY